MSVEPVVTGPLYFAEFQHGQRVNGFPHEVPSGGGILTLGVLEGFLYLTENFAVMLWVPLSFFGCSLMSLHTREWSVSQSVLWLLQVERTLLRLVITRSSWCHLRDQGCFHVIWCCGLQSVGYAQIVHGAKFQKSLSIFVHSAGNRDVQDKRTRLGSQITRWEPGTYIPAWDTKSWRLLVFLSWFVRCKTDPLVMRRVIRP